MLEDMVGGERGGQQITFNYRYHSCCLLFPLQDHAAEGGDFAGIHGTGNGFERWVDSALHIFYPHPFSSTQSKHGSVLSRLMSLTQHAMLQDGQDRGLGAPQVLE